MKIVLNDFDIPINVHEIPEPIAKRISSELIPYSNRMRVRVYLDGESFTVLHRIDPKIEKGTAIEVDPHDGKKRRVKFERIVGGKWQLNVDRRAGCGRLFETKEHAINAALIIVRRNNNRKGAMKNEKRNSRSKS